MSKLLGIDELRKLDLTDIGVKIDLGEQRKQFESAISEAKKETEDMERLVSNATRKLTENTKKVADLQDAKVKLSQHAVLEVEVKTSAQDLSNHIAAAEKEKQKIDATMAIKVADEIKSAFSSVAGWNDEGWKQWSPPSDLSQLKLPNFLRIGETKSGIPVGVPFIKEDGGAHVVEISGATEKRDMAHALMENLVLRIALSMPKVARFSLVEPGNHRCFKGRKELPSVRVIDRLSKSLEEINNDIVRINNEVLGRANSLDHLSSEAWKTEQFESIFVSDMTHPEILGELGICKQLAKIGSSGSLAGRFLFVYADSSVEFPEKVAELEFGSVSLIDLDDLSEDVVLDLLPSPDEETRLLNVVKTQKEAAKSTNIEDLVGSQLDTGWKESSIDFIETSVGENLSVWFGEKNGRNCPHGALAGTSGSGKSNFLHMLILGLSLRYSPDELQLYLVDGKAGVGFQRYEGLPHARVVSLRTPPLLALSVLQELLDEMNSRYEKFGQAGVKDLSSYRRNTSSPMPRLLLVADEYQELFEYDAQRASEIIKTLAEKGRAAGVHLFLSSQSFTAGGMLGATAIFGNIAMRASLQLAESPMGYFGDEGRKLVKSLDRPGMVVINDNLGSDPNSNKGMTASITDEESSRLLGKIKGLAKESNVEQIVLKASGNPKLEGSQTIQYFESLPSYLSPENLEHVASQDVRNGGLGINGWHVGDIPIAMVLGRRFEVYGDTILTLKSARQENVLLVGSDTKQAKDLLCVAILSALYIHDKDNLELYIADAGRADMPNGMSLERLSKDVVQELGYQTQFFRGEEGVSRALSDLAELTNIRSRDSSVSGTPVVLVLSDLDFVEEQAEVNLTAILKEGPRYGVHVILQCSTTQQFWSLFSEGNAKKNLRLFNHKVMWQMSEEDSRLLVSSKKASMLKDLSDCESVLYYNTQSHQSTSFATYLPMKSYEQTVMTLKDRPNNG